MTKYRLAICKGPDCRRNGAEAVASAAREILLRERLAGKCELYRGGCYGLCHMGPNVVVRVDTGKPRDFLSQEDFQLMGWPGEVHYPRMNAEKMAQVLVEHVGRDVLIEELRDVGDVGEAASGAALKLGK